MIGQSISQLYPECAGRRLVLALLDKRSDLDLTLRICFEQRQVWLSM